MRRNYLLIALMLLLTFAQQIFAYSCPIKSSLSKRQLKYLKMAKEIERTSLNRTILGKNIYRVDIMYSEQRQQFFVLLGETHIKGPRSAYIGSKITKYFPLHLVEGVPSAEIAYLAEHYPALSDEIGIKRDIFKYLTFNFFGSTINAAYKRGIGFGTTPGVYVSNGERVVNSSVKVDSANDILRSVNLVGMSSRGITLPLEVGEFITPTEDDSYILDARNDRMASNIKTYITSRLAKRFIPLAIVGAAHNPGLIERLEQNSDFIKCDNF